jgi:hypothetical protein
MAERISRGITFIAALAVLVSVPVIVSGQEITGKVLTIGANDPVAYANVVVIGKSTGTISDTQGNFKLNLAKCNDSDTLHFSMIGYESKSLALRQFKAETAKTVYLKPAVYSLREVVCSPMRNYRQMRIGTPIYSDAIRSGFSDNTLGSEMGIKVNVNRKVRLKDLNLNVSVCTYDSVSYRLNIYQTENQNTYKNILTEPIYVTFTRNEADDYLSFDLSDYSIVVEGEVVIALQLYKDLGEGKLLFHTNFLSGSTQFRKTNDDTWAQATGEIGMYLNGDILR